MVKIAEFKDTPLEEDGNPVPFNIEIDKRIIKCLISPMFTRSNSYVGYIIILIDVTKEVEMDQLRSHFISNVSHELRTPISVILSECEYAEECVDNVDDFKEVVTSIKTQAVKMSKLVSELLMISRMDNNRLKLNFEDTDISELLTFVCEEQVEIQTKKISLIQNIEPNIICKVDRLLITRLFINLISNAYQYSDENTKILVSLMRENNKVIFSVEDEGIGIAEEDIEKIWNRFYQVNPSRTSEDGSGSSGLGLSMVKWISDSHQGELNVTSTIGKGSTFSFILSE